MAANPNFTSLNVPVGTAEDFKMLKIAYSYATGRILTYGEILERLMSQLERTEPEVWECYRNLKAQ